MRSTIFINNIPRAHIHDTIDIMHLIFALILFAITIPDSQGTSLLKNNNYNDNSAYSIDYNFIYKNELVIDTGIVDFKDFRIEFNSSEVEIKNVTATEIEIIGNLKLVTKEINKSSLTVPLFEATFNVWLDSELFILKTPSIGELKGFNYFGEFSNYYPSEKNISATIGYVFGKSVNLKDSTVVLDPNEKYICFYLDNPLSFENSKYKQEAITSPLADIIDNALTFFIDPRKGVLYMQAIFNEMNAIFNLNSPSSTFGLSYANDIHFKAKTTWGLNETITSADMNFLGNIWIGGPLELVDTCILPGNDSDAVLSITNLSELHAMTPTSNIKVGMGGDFGIDLGCINSTYSNALKLKMKNGSYGVQLAGNKNQNLFVASGTFLESSKKNNAVFPLVTDNPIKFALLFDQKNPQSSFLKIQGISNLQLKEVTPFFPNIKSTNFTLSLKPNLSNVVAVTANLEPKNFQIIGLQFQILDFSMKYVIDNPAETTSIKFSSKLPMKAFGLEMNKTMSMSYANKGCTISGASVIEKGVNIEMYGFVSYSNSINLQAKQDQIYLYDSPVGVSLSSNIFLYNSSGLLQYTYGRAYGYSVNARVKYEGGDSIFCLFLPKEVYPNITHCERVVLPMLDPYTDAKTVNAQAGQNFQNFLYHLYLPNPTLFRKYMALNQKKVIMEPVAYYPVTIQ